MAKSEIVYVAISPPVELEENLIKKVAAIVDKDLYETRLHLTGKIPRIISQYDMVHRAELTAQRLRALNLVAIVCKDSDLRKTSQRYKAHAMEFNKQAILFSDKSGQMRRLESKDVFLIIKGRIQTYKETEVISTSLKFSLPATVLTGGIPIWRRIKEKTKDKSVETEYFVRLYDWVSLEPSVEMLDYDLDYSCLGVKMAASSTANFNAVTTTIRNIFSQAIFDDRLLESFGTDLAFTTPRDNIEINCKLIYLYHRTMCDLGSSV
jgi:hypothetical protein